MSSPAMFIGHAWLFTLLCRIPVSYADYVYDYNKIIEKKLDAEEYLLVACDAKVVVDFSDYSFGTDEVAEFSNRNVHEQTGVLIGEIRDACLRNRKNKSSVQKLRSITVRRGTDGHRRMTFRKSGDLLYFAARNKNESGMNVSDFVRKDLTRELQLEFDPANRAVKDIALNHPRADLTREQIPPELNFNCTYYSCEIPYGADEKPNGIEKCYDSDKRNVLNLRREITWKNGVRDGPAKCYEDGKVRFEYSYARNLLHGPMIERNSDANGDRVMNYQDGRQVGYRFSVKNGSITSFDECYREKRVTPDADRECQAVHYGTFEKLVRAKLSDINAKNTEKRAQEKARQNGPQVEKDADGKITAKYTTKGGAVFGKYLQFHANGKVKVEIDYSSKGLREGDLKEFDEEGRVRAKGLYQEDELSTRTEYAMNGKPTLTDTWSGKYPKQKRCRTLFFSNGEKSQCECFFDSNRGWGYWSFWSSYGSNDGPIMAWYENGKLLYSGQYESGARIGTWKYHDADGKTSVERFYVKGTQVRETRFEDGHRIIIEFNLDGSVKSTKTLLEGKI